MKTPRDVVAALKRERNIVIATHIDPDGDAIGSALALSAALESIGKKTFLYNRDPVPQYYRFLPGHQRFSRTLKGVADIDPMLVLLDCNSPDRAAIGPFKFRNSLVIDHHETEKDFGELRWIVPSAAATGLMIFFLIKDLGIPCTKEISVNLYAAICVDTGTFRHTNTSAEALSVAAELVEYGAEPSIISNYLYDTWEKKRFDLFVMALNTLEVKGRIATMHVTSDMFTKTGTKAEDTENFSNFPKKIAAVQVSSLLREVDGGIWKVSLRSKDDVNVAKIAQSFGGGGHRNAAGFRIKADLKTAKAAVMKALKTRQ